MNVRKVHTKIWQDDAFASYSKNGKILFLYLLTNPKIGFTGMFECSDRVILFDTGLTKKELEDTKLELIESCVFYNGWVFVKKAQDYDPIKGDKNPLLEALSKEEESIPEGVYEYFNAPSKVLTEKEKEPQRTIDGLNGNGKGMVMESRDKSPREGTENGKAVIQKFNDLTGKKLKNSLPFEDNLEYWLKMYTLEEVFTALEVGIADSFWRDKLDPTILLRTKDQEGRDVDRVGQFLAKASKTHIKPKDNLLAIAQGSI